MTLDQTFCASPWFHMRITNDGGMTYCRWADKTVGQASIQHQSPVEFFQRTMQPIRQSLLDGQDYPGCTDCYQMEQHHKVSGRQKQLLKIGVHTSNFDRTLRSSPWLPVFTSAQFSQLPQDWQVDLGNYCNSACVFCGPHSSSRLATEYLELKLIDALPPVNWCNDPDLLNKFFDALRQTPHIKYMHFIGGETLITPAFAQILQYLIDQKLHQSLAIGFTTNLTVWPQSVIDLLQQFETVHVGVSIEAFAPINEYVRYPADQTVVEYNFDRWVGLSKKQQWYMQIRSTPTLLSLPDLLTLYDRAWDLGLAIESCNFLQQPEFLKPSVLPMHVRLPIISSLDSWLQSHGDNCADTVVNTRDPNVAKQQICQDLQSYVNYLESEPDESYRLTDLVQYLRRIESLRKNRVLQYRPEYEEIFRAAGY